MEQQHITEFAISRQAVKWMAVPSAREENTAFVITLNREH